MKSTTRAMALGLVLAALGAAAQAQSGKTREQVRNELAEAIRSGDIIQGESGLTLRELYPRRYPQAPRPAALSRAQVQAELAQAIREGTLLVGGEIAYERRDATPGAFPREAIVGAKTREQVQSELAQAIRSGEILAAGELGLPRNLLDPQHGGMPHEANMAASMGNSPKGAVDRMQ